MKDYLAKKQQARAAKIRQKLATLNPSKLRVIDDSEKHIGHIGSQQGAGHFTIEIAAAIFNGKPLLQCHRQINTLLADMLHSDIHALSIQIQPDDNAKNAN